VLYLFYKYSAQVAAGAIRAESGGEGACGPAAAGAAEEAEGPSMRAAPAPLRCALRLPADSVHEDSGAVGGDPCASAPHAVAAAGFEAALLSNANLVGDNCNRGMLLGSLLGLVYGAHNLPTHLIAGLHRRAEIEATVAAFSRSLVSPQLAVLRTARVEASGARIVMTPRFGRPSPLPILRYPVSQLQRRTAGGAAVPVAEAAADALAAGIAVGAPTDLACKLAAIHRHCAAASASLAAGPGTSRAQLRYARAAGAVLLPPPAVASSASLQRATRLLLPAGDGVRAVLDEGEAAKDRTAALTAIAAGAASGVFASGSEAAAAALRESATDGLLVPLRGLPRACLDEESAVNVLLDCGTGPSGIAVAARVLGVEAAAGTGVFYYAPAGLVGTIRDDCAEDGLAPLPAGWRGVLHRHGLWRRVISTTTSPTLTGAV